MAVYTPVTATDLAGFLTRYDCGRATSFKGIAEGVSNSNFLVDTTSGRYVLTLYERNIDANDLPWFLSLMTHLADKGLPVPRPIADRDGHALQTLNGRAACLIAFAQGVSIAEPTPAECHAVGAALGRLHRATADFVAVRANSLGVTAWRPMAAKCGAGLAKIDPALPVLVADALAATDSWPTGLPVGTIHADLFPDNVLLDHGDVTGMIDFYFACTDIRAYDYVVTHAAWCFSAIGTVHYPDRAAALAAGYAETHGLEPAEVAALPRLGEGAALRFVLTRAYDWLHTPPEALVTRKDPMAFARRLAWYARATPDAVLGR
ncbi:homoserine kinase [Polymorphobacter fuscus]|uniref:Homoserine kinase n=1 Tax=Sandarakinorhabdus fusca TaxID=1439888 RepID=A0A7C9KL31_9SPHN|nr:homoserine kinase [Polymorphobacter fuscus]KAB7648512.1 homoserine kinase [Polymorphobacter fuscus]MQT16044.1 homoserine kinase [Polymorphobacter fuscus]NJC07678.1 homoserine kinase type II [Polymorphobacter fuscus]